MDEAAARPSRRWPWTLHLHWECDEADDTALAAAQVTLTWTRPRERAGGHLPAAWGHAAAAAAAAGTAGVAEGVTLAEVDEVALPWERHALTARRVSLRAAHEAGMCGSPWVCLFRRAPSAWRSRRPVEEGGDGDVWRAVVGEVDAIPEDEELVAATVTALWRTWVEARPPAARARYHPFTDPDAAGVAGAADAEARGGRWTVHLAGLRTPPWHATPSGFGPVALPPPWEAHGDSDAAEEAAFRRWTAAVVRPRTPAAAVQAEEDWPVRSDGLAAWRALRHRGAVSLRAEDAFEPVTCCDPASVYLMLRAWQESAKAAGGPVAPMTISMPMLLG